MLNSGLAPLIGAAAGALLGLLEYAVVSRVLAAAWERADQTGASGPDLARQREWVLRILLLGSVAGMGFVGAFVAVMVGR